MLTHRQFCRVSHPAEARATARSCLQFTSFHRCGLAGRSLRRAPPDRAHDRTLGPDALHLRPLLRGGYTPIDYVHSLLVEEVKQSLETTGGTNDETGREVGGDDPASFRRLFKRKTGLTPCHYRRKLGPRRVRTTSQERLRQDGSYRGPYAHPTSPMSVRGHFRIFGDPAGKVCFCW